MEENPNLEVASLVARQAISLHNAIKPSSRGEEPGADREAEEPQGGHVQSWTRTGGRILT